MTLRQKYTPQKSSEFIGNDIAKEVIKSLLQREVNNFVISGPPGVGKKTMARLIGKNFFKEKFMVDSIIQWDDSSYVRDRVADANGEEAGRPRFFIVDTVGEPDFSKVFPVLDAAPVYIHPLTAKQVLDCLLHVKKEEGLDLDDTVLSLIAEDCGGRLGTAYSLLESAIGLDAIKYYKAVKGQQPLQSMEVSAFCDALRKDQWDEAKVALKNALASCGGDWEVLLDATISGLVESVLSGDTKDKRARAATALSHFLKVIKDGFFVPADREKIATIGGMFLATYKGD